MLASDVSPQRPDHAQPPRLLQAARDRRARPVREIPFKPSRMIHFLDFSNEKMVAKVPDIAPKADILLGNLEDAVPVDRKEAARAGPDQGRPEMDLGDDGAVDARQRARVAVGARRPHPRSSPRSATSSR